MPSRREFMHSDYFSEDEDSYGYEDEVYEDPPYSPSYDSENEYSDYENNNSYKSVQSVQSVQNLSKPPLKWETVVLFKKPVQDNTVSSPVVEKAKKTWGKIEKQVTKSLIDIQKEEVELAKRPPPPPPPPQRPRLSDARPRLLSTTASRHPRILSAVESDHDRNRDRDRKQTELLCIHGLRHKTSGCKMAHSFEDWHPKTCRFNNCRNGVRCIYWHKQQEDRKEYFMRCVHNPNSFFFKNKDIYDRNYLSLSSAR
jgi:hypothetical protein